MHRHHPKIRALLLLLASLCGERCLVAQYSGIGVVTPSALPNPAVLSSIAGQWAWFGYEPSRFGLPELHRVYAGVSVAPSVGWSAAVEVWGRAVERFSQLQLRTMVALQLSELFAVGGAAAIVRHAPGGMPSRWWGTLDVGACAQLSHTLSLGIGLQNALTVNRFWEGALEQRLGVGLGWQEAGWGCGFDAEVGTMSAPVVGLTVAAAPIQPVAAALRFAGSPPQARMHILVRWEDIAVHLHVGFHLLLGWRQTLTLLYRWA